MCVKIARQRSGGLIQYKPLSWILETSTALFIAIFPRESFDAGMIFLHELVHRHLKMKDPTAEEVKRNRHVKGPTVEYVNRIERELGVPERLHYAPMKIRYVREDPKWGIYFGNKPTASNSIPSLW